MSRIIRNSIFNIPEGSILPIVATSQVVPMPLVLEVTISQYLLDNYPSVDIIIPHQHDDGLGLGNNYNFDYLLDFGDGSEVVHVTSYNDVKCSHSYTVAGVYDISITGVCENIDVTANTAFGSALTSIISWGTINFKAISFAGQVTLASIPTDTYGAFKDITSFANAFSLTGITSIPDGLLNYCTNVTSFSNTFNQCVITTIPLGLFDNCPLVTDFSGVFNSYALTSIPAGLFDKCINVTTFHNTFLGCLGITTIPTGLFDHCPLVTDFSGVFSQCSALTMIPTGLFDHCPAVTDMSSAFYYNSITEIPTGLFDGFISVTDFTSVFSGSQVLTSIPATLFDTCVSAVNFTTAFAYSMLIAGNAPELWVTFPSATGTSCFTNCFALTNLSDAQTAGWA